MVAYHSGFNSTHVRYAEGFIPSYIHTLIILLQVIYNSAELNSMHYIAYYGKG